MKKGFKDIENYFLSTEEQKVNRNEGRLKALTKEIERLNKLLKERDRKIKMLEAQGVSVSRIELLIEVTLRVASNEVARSANLNFLFSKKFRDEITTILMQKPFLFEAFMSSLPNIGHEKDKSITIKSAYGSYVASFSKLDAKTFKFEHITSKI